MPKCGRSVLRGVRHKSTRNSTQERSPSGRLCCVLQMALAKNNQKSKNRKVKKVKMSLVLVGVRPKPPNGQHKGQKSAREPLCLLAPCISRNNIQKPKTKSRKVKMTSVLNGVRRKSLKSSTNGQNSARKPLLCPVLSRAPCLIGENQKRKVKMMFVLRRYGASPQGEHKGQRADRQPLLRPVPGLCAENRKTEK